MTGPLPDAALPPVEVAAAALDDALDDALEQALQQPALHAAVLAQPGADGPDLTGDLAAAVVGELAVAVVTDLAADQARDGAVGLTAVEQRRIGFYAASAKAAATRRAYLGAWRGFSSWCASTSRQPLPAVDGHSRRRGRDAHGEDVRSSIIAAFAAVKEGSTWSARSAASTNDVDADERRRIIGDEEGADAASR